jgi:hypothetical protein
MHRFLPVKGVQVRHGSGGCSCPGLYLPLNTIQPYLFIQFVLENRDAGGERRQDFEINVVLSKLLSLLLATKLLRASPRSAAARLRVFFDGVQAARHEENIIAPLCRRRS